MSLEKECRTKQKRKKLFQYVSKVQDLCRNHLSRDYGENEATSLSDVLFYSQKEYVDQKGKTKKKRDKTSSPVLYVKLIYSSVTKKFSTIFIVKGKKEVKPLDYVDKYFKTRMLIIFDSIYLGKNSVSIQVRAHEVHILPFGENDDDEVESEQENDDEDVVVESEQEEDDEHYENEIED